MDFSVNYDATDVDDIEDIHKCLMKRFRCVKKVLFLGLTIL